MTITNGGGPLDGATVDSVIDALVRSETITDFCRAIVHSEFTNNQVQGCHFYLLDSNSHLQPVQGYGLTYLSGEVVMSAWDEDPVAKCVRNKDFEFAGSSKDREKGILAIPLMKDNIPVGALALILDPLAKKVPIHENLIPILSKLGTYCLTVLANNRAKNGNGLGNGFGNGNRESNGEDLTSRQIKILELMADGMVNVEIARELMLSESTIRQETVRIYRALGVPNRAEAAMKGRQLGLIKRPQIA